ncbi:hypothetical protein SAMN02745753_01278 [Marinomonas polaris DSM 16579]|uniref:Uncharacterized protein n=1 Tax=Marinomonas polaris DSM 16579 TaxID=1122206 RepID=A0A1M4YP58_9GAMM|nr:hypothetical protein [Marinomonas polaris]SHF07574.1 hypothetical protein SAMN02745753_01278 [Marinomonas polaris DSM 16579]
MNSIITYEVDEKGNQISHDAWLTQQVNVAFDRMENGLAVFVSNEEANALQFKKTAPTYEHCLSFIHKLKLSKPIY